MKYFKILHLRCLYSLRKCRNEATRTPDPYVPNVVRYQLRYIPYTKILERNMGFEPTTLGLGSQCSTTELISRTTKPL